MSNVDWVSKLAITQSEKDEMMAKLKTQFEAFKTELTEKGDSVASVFEAAYQSALKKLETQLADTFKVYEKSRTKANRAICLNHYSRMKLWTSQMGVLTKWKASKTASASAAAAPAAPAKGGKPKAAEPKAGKKPEPASSAATPEKAAPKAKPAAAPAAAAAAATPEKKKPVAKPAAPVTAAVVATPAAPVANGTSAPKKTIVTLTTDVIENCNLWKLDNELEIALRRAGWDDKLVPLCGGEVRLDVSASSPGRVYFAASDAKHIPELSGDKLEKIIRENPKAISIRPNYKQTEKARVFFDAFELSSILPEDKIDEDFSRAIHRTRSLIRSALYTAVQNSVNSTPAPSPVFAASASAATATTVPAAPTPSEKKDETLKAKLAEAAELKAKADGEKKRALAEKKLAAAKKKIAAATAELKAAELAAAAVPSKPEKDEKKAVSFSTNSTTVPIAARPTEGDTIDLVSGDDGESTADASQVDLSDDGGKETTPTAASKPKRKADNSDDATGESPTKKVKTDAPKAAAKPKSNETKPVMVTKTSPSSASAAAAAAAPVTAAKAAVAPVAPAAAPSKDDETAYKNYQIEQELEEELRQKAAGAAEWVANSKAEMQQTESEKHESTKEATRATVNEALEM